MMPSLQAIHVTMHLLSRQRTSYWLERIMRLLPSACALCGTSQQDCICADCRHQFFNTAARHRCSQCAAPLFDSQVMVCGNCLQQARSFDATIAAADYAPPTDQLVQALKFGGRLALAPLFAELLRDALLNVRAQNTPLPDLLIAVPLGPQRLAERGFNQALEIAKPLARKLGIPLAHKLAWRTRDTRAQSLLPLQDRQNNLHNAFSIEPQTIGLISGRHIGVVDDVLTTGTTLNELAATLKRFGAQHVTNLVFARTP
ncbi:MAG: ComF family protein [Burkholderiales bacterium]|nr:ComF family protein [Burkholderiales bacterium]